MTRRSGLMYLNLAHFLDHFFLLVFPTAVIAIEADWQLSYGESLALGSPLYIAFAVATLPAGWLGDHVCRRKLISVFFLGCGGASVLTGLASGPWGLTIGLVLLGTFAAIYHPVGLAMVTEWAERPGRALAINGVFGNMGLAGAALATGVLAEHLGWRSAFLVPGLVSIAIGSTHAWQCRQSAIGSVANEASRRDQFVPVGWARQVRVFAIVLVAALFGGAVFNTVTISLPKLFDERLLNGGVDLIQVGSYAALVFAFAAFAQLPVGDLLDRFGARKILIALLLSQIGALILIANTHGMLVVPAAAVLVLLVFAEIPITGWLLGHYMAPTWRARAFSVEYVLSLGMGAAIVPAIAWGHRAGHGFDSQYLVLAGSAGVVLVAACFLPALGRGGPRDARSWTAGQSPRRPAYRLRDRATEHSTNV